MESKNRIVILILITILFLLAILAAALIHEFPLKKEIEVHTPVHEAITYESKEGIINEIYIYGTHLNIKGELENNEELKETSLVLINKFNEEIKINSIVESKDGKIYFRLSDQINKGLYLDSYKIGTYSFFIKTIDNDDKVKYYPLKNNTNYKTTKYYSIIKNGKRNKFEFKNENSEYPTLTMEVTFNRDDDIYDITIDAGHGGKDPGACYNGRCETDYTLDLAFALKKSLEERGLKIKLTRESNNGSFPTYNEGGRVVVPQDANSKYLFSFHLNSSGYNGVEIYAPYNTDLTLATDIATYITSYTGTNYSYKGPYKVKNGVYVRTFRQHEIDAFNKEIDEDGYPRYNINYETNYYYIIRETGGYITGAYTDGRDGKLNNPYVLSNKGVESYIMEIGYITDDNDVYNITNNKAKYIEAITQAILNNIYK